MSTPKELARNTVDAFNRRDWDRMKSLLSPDSVYEEVGTGRNLNGQKQIIEVMRGWVGAFDDARGEVTNALDKGNHAVLEITWTGTHNGSMEGPSGPIPPSGKSTTTRAIQFVRCENDRVVETKHYLDFYSLLRQIGAISTEKARKAGA